MRRMRNITQEDLNGVQYRDAIKTNYAARRGISLTLIKYTDINRIPKILSELLTT